MKFGMRGSTIKHHPKDTYSRCKKFLMWYYDSLNAKINGKAKTIEEKYNL